MEDEFPTTGMVAFSGGKDSAAMLLRMLELWTQGDKRYPITKITFADTGFELPELIEYIRMIEAYIQETYPELNLKIDFVGSPRTWEDWFYGEITKGNNKGKQRGAPLRAYPCYWAREAKVQPLQKAQKDCDVVYIGIAADKPTELGRRRTRGMPRTDTLWSIGDGRKPIVCAISTNGTWSMSCMSISIALGAFIASSNLLIHGGRFGVAILICGKLQSIGIKRVSRSATTAFDQ